MNQGCGELKYDLVEFSWTSLWELGNDIVYASQDQDYYTDEGIRIMVNANERFQIGEHQAKLQVKADSTVIPISTTQMITFIIEILDCKVNSYDVGTQELEDIVL